MAEDYGLRDRIKDLGDSIAEQFRNIVRQLEIIDNKLDSKASLVQLSQLEERLTKVLDRHDKEIGDLQSASQGGRALLGASKWLIAGVGIPLLGVIATLVWLASGGH